MSDGHCDSGATTFGENFGLRLWGDTWNFLLADSWRISGVLRQRLNARVIFLCANPNNESLPRKRRKKKRAFQLGAGTDAAKLGVSTQAGRREFFDAGVKI